MSSELNLLQMLDLNGDQVQSQFIISFPNVAFWNSIPGIPENFDPRQISLRTTSWQPPEPSLYSYDIAFQGLKMKKIGPTEQTDKAFSLSIRFDEDWIIYRAFKAWQNYRFNPLDGTSAPEKLTRTTMQVDYHNGSTRPRFRQTFLGVQIETVPIGSYDAASGDPVTADFRFNYVLMEETFNPG